ncbi:MAG: hypothetical protein HC828_06015 [Blastochloris sp.]|nr:hypothetical protein [Blastochloris sp.]
MQTFEPLARVPDASAFLICSLRDVQGQRYMTDAEFATWLRIDTKTLRRLHDPAQRHTISVATKRRIATTLGRPPHTIVELLWRPA